MVAAAEAERYGECASWQVKTRWEFHFAATGFKFARQIAYRVTATDLERDGCPAPSFARSFGAALHPDEKPIDERYDQTGKLNLIFDSSPEESKEFAYWAAYELAGRISFEHGNMDILGGLVTWERIPETEHEREEIGNTPFGADLTLEEVMEPPAFDPARVRAFRTDPEMTRLQALFNESKRSRTPVDQYLGFFRVLEYLYAGAGGHKKLDRALVNSPALVANLRNVAIRSDGGGRLSDAECSALVRELVRMRHRCAHLKRDFGIVPIDNAVESQLMPLLPIAADLAKLAIDDAFGNEPTSAGSG